MPSGLFLFLLSLLISFSLLARASVGAFPATIIVTSIAALASFWFIAMAYARKLVFLKTGLFMPCVFFLGLALLQTIKLPPSVVSFLSFNTACLYRTFLPQGSGSNFFSLSIYPDATIAELLKIGSFFGVFFLVINVLREKKDLIRLMNVIIFLGSIISLFGIIQRYAASYKTSWFGLYITNINSFGPFLNRNNFAGYINMVIPLTLGYALADISVSRRIIYAFSLGIMSWALYLSLSRAGILVYMATVFFFLCLSTLKKYFRQRSRLVLTSVILVFCLFIFVMESGVILKRLSTLFDKKTFIVLGHGYSWLDCLRIWKDFPVFGTGLGTFGNISSMYNSDLNETQILYTYAHNDYLQLLIETGLLGFLCIAWFFILYFLSVIKAWRERHDPHVICLVLGGLSSIVAMLFYSLLDFNLHIPANALLFFVILASVYRLGMSNIPYVVSR